MPIIDLKPCPFCGGEAELTEFNNGFFVMCKTNNCHANAETCNPFYEWEVAVLAWNRRADNER